VRAHALDEDLGGGAFEVRLGAAPALAFVLLARAVVDGVVGGLVGDRIDGRLDAQPALEQRVVAVALDDVAAHVLGEVGRHLAEALAIGAQAERLVAGGVCPLGLDEAEPHHLVQHQVAAAECALRVARGRVPRRRLGETGDERHLRQRKLVEILVEVAPGGALDPVGTMAQEDLVQVHREDGFFAVAGLEAARDDGFFGLAGEGLLAAEELLGDLLGDRRAALGEVAGDDVAPGRAHDALEVDAVVREVLVVFGGEEGVDQVLRDVLVRDQIAPLAGKLPE